MPDLPEPYKVPLSIYEAGKELEEEAKKRKDGLTDFHLAEMRRHQCREKGENEQADFWHKVFQHLMTLTCCGEDEVGKLEIIEDE